MANPYIVVILMNFIMGCETQTDNKPDNLGPGD